MADFLTIAGVEYGVVQQGGASEGARTYAGSIRRAFDNTLRNMTRSAKRQWNVILAPDLTGPVGVARRPTSLRQPVTCSGTMFGASSPVICSVTATSIPHVAHIYGHVRTVMLTLDEV
jgi:hypothetical protein